MATTNGLVGYDSSSDDVVDDDEEEEGEGEGKGERDREGARRRGPVHGRREAPPTAADTDSPAGVPRPVAGVTAGSSLPDNGDANALHDAVREAAAIGPVLGPDAPSNGNLVVEADSPAQRPEEMGERETIRYLTQPPVPMTAMPPSPPGSPDPAANARFARFRDLKAKGVHFNEDLAQKSSFLNQALLATMMARAGIGEEEQYNTSLPVDMWCPKGFPEWAYKEGLLESQQRIKDKDEAEKRTLSAASTRTIDFAPSSESSKDPCSRATTSSQKRQKRP